MAIDRPSKLTNSAAPDPNAITQKGQNFLKEVITELKKTTWPTRHEAWRLTGVVIGVIVVLGLYMALLDGVIGWFVNKFIGK